MVEVIVAAEEALYRRGLAEILTGDGEIAVHGQAASWQEIFEQIPGESSILLVLDSDLAEKDGFKTVRSLSAACPQIRFLLLCHSRDPECLFAAIRAGAHGILFADIDPPDFIRAVHLAAAGATVVSLEVAGSLRELVRQSHSRRADPQDGRLQVSDREQQVLKLLATGESQRQIAGRLRISPKTVQNHLSSIYRKLGVRSRTEAVVRSLESGLVSLETQVVD